MKGVPALVGLLLGLPGALTALHLSTLAVASLFYRETEADAPTLTFLVLIPAQNEEATIESTVESVVRAARRRDLVLVVADRCRDATADIARAQGVEVYEYDGSQGIGKAAAIGAGLEQMGDRPWDAVVIIDADSIVETGFFEALEAKLALGYLAVQPRSEHHPGTTTLSRVAEAAFALQGVTIPRGRNALGLSVRLRGSGMTFLRSVARTHAFISKGASEDLFYGLQLVAEGHKAGHVDQAQIRSASAPSLTAGTHQRVRWEKGRMAAARAYFFPLIKSGTPSALEAALYLVTPPLGMAVLSLVIGAGVSAVWGWTFVFVGYAMGVAAIAVVVAIGLVQARASWRTWAALLVAPGYVLWKAWIQVKAAIGLSSAEQAYDRTDRE